MYKILKSKYPDIFNKEIRASDIIFLCRDSLRVKAENNIEEEILHLIKQKDWAWYARDIDNNIIITYPIFNGSKKIVDYLIESKKYDINEYNPSLSKAICACISLKGEDMFNYFLNKDLNFRYKNDLITKSLVMASNVKDESHFDHYMKYANDLINDCNFVDVIRGIIYPATPEVFNYFLFNHPLKNEEKVALSKQLIEEYSFFNLSNGDLNSKNKLLEKFEMLTHLQKMPINGKSKKVKKI